MARQKGKKKFTNLKMLVSGWTGSGKTLGALRLAYGITGDWDKITVIDGEDRAHEYIGHPEFNIGEFYITEFTKDMSFKELFKLVEDTSKELSEGEVLIFDQISFAWDMLVRDIGKMSGNGLQNWSTKGNKMWDDFIELLLKQAYHSINIARAKSDTEVGKNADGKMQVETFGTKAKVGKDSEYEFSVVGMMQQREHTMEVRKDTTVIGSNGECVELNEELGKKLAKFFSGGGSHAELVAEETASITNKIKEAAKDQTIKDLVKILLGGKKLADCTLKELKNIWSELSEVA